MTPYLIVYALVFLRLYVFMHSFLRKLSQWSYSPAHDKIQKITLIVWVAIVVTPFCLALLLCYLVMKMNQNLMLTEDTALATVSKRLYTGSLIAIAPLGILISCFAVRERYLINLVSKEFGTVRGFADKLLLVGISNFWGMALVLLCVVLLFSYVYGGVRNRVFLRMGPTLCLCSLLLLYAFYLLNLAVYWRINQLTIETFLV